jgi:hypothetical protein
MLTRNGSQKHCRDDLLQQTGIQRNRAVTSSFFNAGNACELGALRAKAVAVRMPRRDHLRMITQMA